MAPAIVWWKMNLFKHVVIAGRGIRYARKLYKPVTPRAYSVGIVHALNGFGSDGVCYLKRDPNSVPPSCFDRAKDAVSEELSKYEGMIDRDLAVVAIERLYRDNLLRKTRTKPLLAERSDPGNPVANFVEGGNDCASAVRLRARA